MTFATECAPALLPASLDPLDWEDFRSRLHTVADELLDHLRTRPLEPVWRRMPSEVARDLLSPVTRDGLGAERAWEILKDRILPYDVGNVHPRFMGWVHGAGTPGGLVAAMAEAAMNANVGGRDSGAVQVERAVLAWARELFGFPRGTSGVLTSGTSMATVIALAAARQAYADWDLDEDGLGPEGARFRVYASEATHGCVAKALRLLGFGNRALRPIAVDERGRIRLDALERAVAQDRAAGLRPWVLVGNAGTVDVGAVDDLEALADRADRDGLWFHVDGAFGALLRLSPALRSRVEGIERADSLAFDFHKWLHVTYDCGCVLVRDGRQQRRAFRSRPGYLEAQPGGLGGGDPWFCDYGPELSRGFRALRVWFLLVEHGTDALAAAIEGSVARAAHLASRVDREPLLERVGPSELNIVCFRVRPLPDEDPDALTWSVVEELQRRGIAAPSTTHLGGHRVIRCCILNHRTTEEDLDHTVDGVLQVLTELRG
ncbi:MAG: pyridoxal-dependent decarboxylase [Gemmatimonadota bacterium]